MGQSIKCLSPFHAFDLTVYFPRLMGFLAILSFFPLKGPEIIIFISGEERAPHSDTVSNIHV